jgi:hypothetical protein
LGHFDFISLLVPTFSSEVRMIVNCRIDDKTFHTVIWESRVKGSMFRMEEKEKEFDNFLDADGFARGLAKKGFYVKGIIAHKGNFVGEFVKAIGGR